MKTESVFTVTIDYINKDGNVYRTFYEPFYFNKMSEAQSYIDSYLKKFYLDYFYKEEKKNYYVHPETGESRNIKVNLMIKKEDFEISEELKKGEE